MTDFSAYQQLVATAHAEAKERARWAAALAPRPTPSVMTDADCIAADLHNERNKVHAAHLAQTLNAVRLEFQHAQIEVSHVFN